MKKWWESPTAALGALCGEKAEEELRVALQSAAQAEYQRGYEDGKESAVVHAHWETDPHIKWMFRCSKCKGGLITKAYIDSKGQKYCPDCGARMDEVQDD